MFDSGLCSCVCSLKVSAEVVFDEHQRGWETISPGAQRMGGENRGVKSSSANSSKALSQRCMKVRWMLHACGCTCLTVFDAYEGLWL